MKFSKVAHLYLGCECKYIDGAGVERSGKMVSISLGTGIPFAKIDHYLSGDCPVLDNIKPKLYPLSEITKEQFKEVCEIMHYFPDEIYKQADAIWARFALTKERCRLSFDIRDVNTIHFWTEFTDEAKKICPSLEALTEVMLKLREWSFDMDGLIGSGQAIDKSKLQEQ